MKKFLKNLYRAYVNCWESDLAPAWCFIHVMVYGISIVAISQLIPHLMPYIMAFTLIVFIILCLALNWENDEN